MMLRERVEDILAWLTTTPVDTDGVILSGEHEDDDALSVVREKLEAALEECD